MMGVEPVWIDEFDVRVLHERLLAIHGGLAGVRDEGLSNSAIARPRQIANYEPNADLIDLASAYTVGIVKNHPFIDGNKRTGFVVGVLFLELNGHRFTAMEADAADAVLAVAAGILDERGYTAFLHRNAERE
jgi:death-on-curing protein